MTKRIFDITFSFVAITVFSIPMSVICFMLKFKEKHPIIFKQTRMGRDKVPFEIWKFQTMVDEKVTPTGRILRRTGLDELAQFFNVLRGDMSIVGPRALTAYDIERLGWDDAHHSCRWSIKPGITGFAQVFGGQHRKLSWFWDRKYIANSGLMTDFGLIFISFCMNFFGKTRVRRIVFRNKSLK